MYKNLFLAMSLFVVPFTALAQSQPADDENGAVSIYLDSGWSFGLPAVRALVTVPNVGTAISPEKKTLLAPGVGVRITAWKWVVPFFDVTGFDTGKATAQVGSVTSTAEANTFAMNGGVRLVKGFSRVRPYVQFGGGVLHQGLKGTFSAGTQRTTQSSSSNFGSVLYGAGVQMHVSRRAGLDFGFDGYRTGVDGPGSNFSRVRFGIFFQTKSRLP